MRPAFERMRLGLGLHYAGWVFFLPFVFAIEGFPYFVTLVLARYAE